MDQIQLLKSNFWDGMIPQDERFSKVYLKHTPFMITDDNKIVCIPDTKETFHIGTSGMCYDKKTEVLTNKGFKLFSELDKSELIAQVDPKTFEIDFVEPIRYVKEWYEGIMFGFRGEMYDLLVTPEHNMFFAIEKIDETSGKFYLDFSFTKAVSLYQRTNHGSRYNKNYIRTILNIQENIPMFYNSKLNSKNTYDLPYTGHVYCVEVPTHLLIVRRNGRIAICGNTGKGKGIAGNTLLGFEHYMKKIPCIILNDFQQETFENSLPCQNKMFMNVHKIIHAEPVGYPIVYVYPNNKNLTIDEVEKSLPHIKMSMPTTWVIRNIEKFYKLDKSAKYFTANIEKFLECKDLEQIDEALKEMIEENVEDFKNKKSLENMLFKIRTVFKNIFDEKITDNAAPDAPAFLKISNKRIKNYNNFTVQALIATGLIPSIQTSEIRGKPWFSAYMSFIVNSIYDDKYHDEYFFKNTNISLYVPEIDKMWKDTNNPDLIKEALFLLGTNGRRAGIGLRWDAQDYDAVPDSIRSNTKYLIVLRKANAEEVRGIKKNFNVDAEIEKQILSLDTDPSKGLFECVALTVNYFIIYNPLDGSMTQTNLPQKGKLIPPLSQHKVPGTPMSQVIKDYETKKN